MYIHIYVYSAQPPPYDKIKKPTQTKENQRTIIHNT